MTEREIFAQAIGLSDRSAQADFLDRACGENADLRRRVARLLELSQSPSELLDHPPAESLRKDEPPLGLAALQPFLAAATRPDSLGRLGHYEVLEFLGQGGFGIVVKAFDTSLHRVVAIKVLSPHLAITSPPRKRFLREARASAQVQYPHVVQIFAVEEQPLPYLVMEYVEGQTLQERLDDVGPLSTTEVIRIGQQVALGLAAAHEKGLIHRDVKPANILLQAGPQACVKLTDFGIARAGDEASMTQSGVVAGTPLFMSPEQVQGAPLDARTDLFSFGSVLYTMACGHPPFRAPNALAVIKRVAEDRPRPPAQVVPEIPARLSAIILKLLEKQPAKRYASATEVAEVLARCEDGPATASAAWSSGARLTAAAALLVIVVAGIGWLARNGFTANSEKSGTSPVAAIEPNPKPAAHPNADQPAEKENNPETKTTDSTRRTSESPAAVTPIVEPAELDPWSREVRGLPPQQQIDAVIARLKELNPEMQEAGFSHHVENDKVLRLTIDRCGGLRDLAPVRALSGLEDLRLSGNGGGDLSALRGLRLKHFETNGSPITDLSPLAGMPLQALLLWAFPAEDLSPLQDMQLKFVNLGNSNVKDISVLRGMPLEYLCLNGTQVEDLSPLKGAPLKVLECHATRVMNIAPLANSPLQEIYLTESLIADYSPLKSMPLTRVTMNDPQAHAELLRSIPTLVEVNRKPLAEILSGSP